MNGALLGRETISIKYWRGIAEEEREEDRDGKPQPKPRLVPPPWMRNVARLNAPCARPVSLFSPYVTRI